MKYSTLLNVLVLFVGITFFPSLAGASGLMFPPGACTDFNFERPGITSTPQIQSAIATADINQDGIPDVVVTIQDLDFVSIYLGNNDGTFQVERNFAAGDAPAGVAISDLNRDGEFDLAVTALEQTV